MLTTQSNIQWENERPSGDHFSIIATDTDGNRIGHRAETREGIQSLTCEMAESKDNTSLLVEKVTVNGLRLIYTDITDDVASDVGDYLIEMNMEGDGANLDPNIAGPLDCYIRGPIGKMVAERQQAFADNTDFSFEGNYE